MKNLSPKGFPIFGDTQSINYHPAVNEMLHSMKEEFLFHLR